jgi:polar amino acid transport system permease protein
MTMTLFLDQLHSIAMYYPVLLKGIGMTLALSLIGIFAGGIIGLLLGIGRASACKWLSVHHRRLHRCLSRHTGSGSGLCRFLHTSRGGHRAQTLSPRAPLPCPTLPPASSPRSLHPGSRQCPPGSGGGRIRGLTRFQQLRLIVLPQAIRMVVPSLVGQSVLLVKDSSVVSAIGLLDLTRSGWVIVQSIPNGLLVFSVMGLGIS